MAIFLITPVYELKRRGHSADLDKFTVTIKGLGKAMGYTHSSAFWHQFASCPVSQTATLLRRSAAGVVDMEYNVMADAADQLPFSYSIRLGRPLPFPSDACSGCTDHLIKSKTIVPKPGTYFVMMHLFFSDENFRPFALGIERSNKGESGLRFALGISDLVYVGPLEDGAQEKAPSLMQTFDAFAHRVNRKATQWYWKFEKVLHDQESWERRRQEMAKENVCESCVSHRYKELVEADGVEAKYKSVKTDKVVLWTWYDD